MSLLRLPTPGLDLQPGLTISNVAVAAGVSSSFANSGNLCTITTTTPHGLTLNPALGTAPNYFVTFSGVSAQTGVGTLNSNIFRILSIPSTTTFTIYSTITGATLNGGNVIPVFYPPFTASFGSNFAGGPTQTISSVVTPFPPPQLEAASFYSVLAANCTVQAALGSAGVTGNVIILDALSTPAAGTPAVGPTWTSVQPVSSSELNWAAPPNVAVWASTTSAGNSVVAVIN
jgi:hypothetical protein